MNTGTNPTIEEVERAARDGGQLPLKVAWEEEREDRPPKIPVTRWRVSYRTCVAVSSRLGLLVSAGTGLTDERGCKTRDDLIRVGAPILLAEVRERMIPALELLIKESQDDPAS